MKKVYIIAGIVIIIAVYFAFRPSDELVAGEDVSIEGEVVSVNTDAVALDGPALVTIVNENREVVIAVPSMGINLCAARENIADVYRMGMGDRVEVRGRVDTEERVVPCDNTSHYLRVVEQ